ncbi:hypothetical protein HHK36_005912 [Tetracentron sinense]|uniref:Growth-regulating factor n=1 Tax=Tetracentron sinense TaxID=13715 RepID=A0A834ZNE6_TETSI|nr:hypothetical protein HHK36_005912 [Tetracentron sinense]
MMSARNRSPFTASQWQELEHQALIFKYMVSGMPIPPDLIFTIKKSLDSVISSRLFPHQPIGWGCFQMGFGRKADPEPGRCRRTDGKKWRCSKEAFPDSKYCERHMHRGKNRSRKPVEVLTRNSSTPISSIIGNPSITNSNSSCYSLSTLSSSMATETHHHPYYNTPLHPFLYPHSSSSRPPDIGLSPQSNNTTHLLLDSGSYSQHDHDHDPDPDYRYYHGLKEEVDERAFFSEASGTVRNVPNTSIDNPWQLTPLRMSSSMAQSKQKNYSVLENGYSQLQLQSIDDTSKQQQQEQHCFVLGTDFKCERPVKVQREEEPQKPLRHFFDEWPPKNRDSWHDLEEDRSNRASFSTTQLSISIPMSSPDFAVSNSPTQNDD